MNMKITHAFVSQDTLFKEKGRIGRGRCGWPGDVGGGGKNCKRLREPIVGTEETESRCPLESFEGDLYDRLGSPRHANVTDERD